MNNTDYIVEVLGRFEGKAIAKGYVPCKGGIPLGASGVTIGTGFDLGQQTHNTLAALNLPQTLVQKLTPYIGLQKQAAIAALFKQPLSLTPEEVTLLDHAVHETYINETAAMFGRERFEAAPKQVQAVAVSLHYQFGTPRCQASPSLELAWNALRDTHYGAAVTLLSCAKGWSTDHQRYMARRRAEADLLRGMV